MNEREHPASSVPWPTAGIDPRVALATCLHAGPGVYAILVGSGMSSAAGIPTGWQVKQDLVRKIAVAEGVSADEIGDDPLFWWERQGRPEARYDTLLEALAPTERARQLLLRQYFDPDPPITPTAGHEALASLCATGRVRLILTTNFDHLVERALEQIGLSPQVIASPAAVRGMTPLTHAPLTVLKLHGDYATTKLRNTEEELSTYPRQWQSLLARMFDEFGLLVVGWSAEYDTALCEALQKAPARRYPTFWASFKGSLTEPARRLIAQRDATVIDTTGADEFLGELTERIAHLDQMASRRGRPVALRTCNFIPEQSTAPPGWKRLPLLQLRVAAAVGPVSLDVCGIIREKHRDALLDALHDAAVTTRIRRELWPLEPALSRTDSQPVHHQAPLADWQAIPDAHQSTEHASYKLGGDASSGISAIVSARLPACGTGGSAVFMVDLALSLADQLGVGTVAGLFRDGLLLTTVTLPHVFSEILPSDAEVTQAELHILAANTDDNGSRQSNDLLKRLDLTPFGAPTRTVGPPLGYAARLSAPLAEREAAELVIEAIEYMVLASGYLNPEAGLKSLREELGLSNQSA